MGWEIDKKTVLKLLNVLTSRNLLKIKTFNHWVQETRFSFRRVLAIPARMDFESAEVKRHPALTNPQFKSDLTLHRLRAECSLRALRKM